MNQQKKSQQTDESVNPGQKIKRLAAQLTIGDSNLAGEIKRMFDLAKSSGQELDLTFNPETN
jgi:hypothetical protein